ncbi:hypothetical protein ACFXDH_38075 [Streptomyces sp. NPDC059467]|uniref:hypothetical protein n=1 Tax=Streptomyces sp. NPDC059467 TaxID=3346844 RepID=UPI00367E6FCB
MLVFVYVTSTTATGFAFGNHTGQVAQIKQWATDPGASAATATVVTQYAFDTAGRLREEWDPRISPGLKTAYTYGSAGRTARGRSAFAARRGPWWGRCDGRGARYRQQPVQLKAAVEGSGNA